MKLITSLSLFLVASFALADGFVKPLSDGEYTFTMRFNEHPNIPGRPVLVLIRGDHIQVVSHSDPTEFPPGVVVEGMLLWHARTSQWVIGNAPTDRDAIEVGGCSDGPLVIDFSARVFWSC